MNDLDAHGRINFRHLVWMRLQKYRREATWGTYQSESFKTALGDAIKQQQAAAENGHVDDGEMLESRAAASSNSQNAATHEHQRPPKRPTLAPGATYPSESATPASGISGAATGSCSSSHAVTAVSDAPQPLCQMDIETSICDPAAAAPAVAPPAVTPPAVAPPAVAPPAVAPPLPSTQQ